MYAALSTDRFLHADPPKPASSGSSEIICFVVCLIAALFNLILSAMSLSKSGFDPIVNACGGGLYAIVLVHIIIHILSVLAWFTLYYLNRPHREWLQLTYAGLSVVGAIVAAVLTSSATSLCTDTVQSVITTSWVNFAVDVVVLVALGALYLRTKYSA